MKQIVSHLLANSLQLIRPAVQALDAVHVATAFHNGLLRHLLALT